MSRTRLESPSRGLRLLVTVTLNDNQLRAHLEPILALPEVESALLVADVPGPELSKLRTVVPPAILVRTLGRAAAKLLVCTRIAFRERPDVVIAYNLVPHALNAAAVSFITGTPAIFHMIGGPEEWLGGGWRSDNNVLGRLSQPSRLVEKALLHAIKRFDVVATMGPSGRAALINQGVPAERVIELPAAVDAERFHPVVGGFSYDVVSITSLIPRKRPWDTLEILARLHADRPTLRAAIVGQGPLEEQLRRQARELGLATVVDFLGYCSEPELVLGASRVFVLASRYEGLSIALTEAMAMGVPPVVTRVGEAESIISDGETGYLWDVGDVQAATNLIGLLLDDPELRTRVGSAAAGAARNRTSFSRVAAASLDMLQRARKSQ